MATPRLKTDSPLSRRIVSAFLDFLTSVEPSPGVDLEGLEVAKECLADVFKIDPSVDTKESHDLLVSLFRSMEVGEQLENKSEVRHEKLPADAPSTSSVRSAHVNNLGESQTPGEDWMGEVPAFGGSEDELFGRFVGALEKIHYFKRTPDGHDDQDQLDRATQFFFGAVTELKKNSGREMVNAKNLAETFKSQGNKALQAKKYSDSIELYTYAISLCEDNAVYYCNRAAAYTQINKYGEAIRDSLKSIEIDPNYGKAYSRLGFAYYAMGNYRDAIDKGFSKALQLDPNNDSVKENIRVAEQKLREQQGRNNHNQRCPYTSSGTRQETGQQSAGGSRNQTPHPPFSSMTFDTNDLPPNFANMFMNMASNIHPPEGQQVPSNNDTFSEPEVRVGGGSVNINLGEQMPEEVSGVLRSVMHMFSGNTHHDNNQGGNNNNGGSAQS